jgi:hypothetical protein
MKYLLLILSIFITSNVALAQLKDCNAFLKGAYVELGINWNGAYGSSTDAPAGYHPLGATPIRDTSLCGGICDRSGLNLGFVADPDKDGWTVGTPPYFGDYFLPGFPQEGWSIQIDSFRADAWNVRGCDGLITPGLMGSNISLYATGHEQRAIWQGVFDSVQITQVTTLDSLDAFFNVHIILKNLSHKTLNNIYYLRTVDPDNDEQQSGGSFTTKNKIEYQQPNPLNAAMVSATAVYHSQARLSLGTQDSFAKCFIITIEDSLVPKVGVGVNGLDSMYGRFNGLGDTSSYQYQDSNIADEAIGLVFKVKPLSPADSAIISFAYIFSVSPIDIDSALIRTTSPWSLDTSTKDTSTNVVQLSSIKTDIEVYPNPFSKSITIKGGSIGDRVNIYDNTGKLSGTYVLRNAETNTITLGTLKAGIYILELRDKYGAILKSISLQKQ